MTKIKQYFYLCCCLMGAALNFNIILKPLSLVTGGTQGLAILLNYFWRLAPSLLIFIINILMLILSFLFLEKKRTTSVIVATFVYPLFVKLTSNLPTFIFIQNYKYLAVIIAGVFCGITGGFIYRLGFSAGGLTILNLIINKYLKIKLSLVNFIINTFIIILGLIYFGIEKIILALIVVSIGSIIINSILKNDIKD